MTFLPGEIGRVFVNQTVDLNHWLEDKSRNMVRERVGDVGKVRYTAECLGGSSHLINGSAALVSHVAPDIPAFDVKILFPEKIA
jgi:hypothetical protein